MLPANNPNSAGNSAAEAAFRQAVLQAAGNGPFLDQLGEILHQGDLALAEYRPACRGCGICCDFAKMDHRLYVSTGELALLTRAGESATPAELRCPYQAGANCTAREFRPLGCRMFFCDANLTDTHEAIYEKFHGEIRLLHHRFDIEYFYVELTAALCRLNRR
ncbi:MAG: YkgJ family cysteine cluster protein [Phycisphaerae bacterium]|nr:YkgJ family cysteine cluster protein [Phycisphaerae bacterium]